MSNVTAAISGHRNRPRHASGHPFLIRLVVAAGLTAFAFLTPYTQLVVEALNGSRAAYGVVLPVLMIVIATGYRVPPRGVRDGESDWIVVALVAVTGFAAIRLLGERLPTLAGLWHLPLQGIVLWFACVLAVLLGVRHVARMWPLWVFAVCCATPLPYLLTVAMFGGTQTAAALVTAGLGAAAVCLAGRLAPLPWRLAATLGCAAISTAFVFSGVPGNLLVMVVVVGAVVPVAATAALRLAERTDDESLVRSHPRQSPVAPAVLAALSAAIFVLQPTVPTASAVPTAHPAWTQRSQLGTPEEYDFAARFLGEGATLRRYPVPPVAGMPVAVVDVMSSPDLAALDDFSDAVWYPTSRPLDYRPAGLSGVPNLDSYRAGVIHTDASTATDSASRHWYAVTWVWHADDSFQRVTVVVNQDVASNHQPPPPAPLTLMNSGVEPALWIARQQATADGAVDPLVKRRATGVVEYLLASAAEDEGDPQALTGA